MLFVHRNWAVLGRGYTLRDRICIGLLLLFRSRPGFWRLLALFYGKRDWCVRVGTPHGPARVVFDPLDPTELTVVDELLDETLYVLQGDRPDVLLDCGAFRGISTIYLQDQAQAGIVEAYEPQPDNFAVLKRRLATFCPTARARNVAVGCSAAEVSFSGEGVGGRIERGTKSGNDITVQQIQLNASNVFATAKHLLLKMDVEGEEVKILPDLLKVLPRRCTVFLETHGSEAEAQELLRPYREAGFTVRMRRVRNDSASERVFIDWELGRLHSDSRNS